ncbi:MAG: excalibur calcium-binding domain-containing protein [Actinomycetota bacterium]|nr:excalibur calcium-binding domain-containing protein [Actinomycetota bacterium]
MHRTHRIPALLGSCALVVAGALAATPAEAHTTGIHDNCTNLHTKWPHGVGRRDAKDETSGTPVTNFFKSNRQYRRAVNHNPDLDRDRDTIACEQA